MNIDEHEQINSDVPQDKPDVLRAIDIIPSSSGNKGSVKQKYNIPEFNLAKEIMAEQRQSRARRLSPLHQQHRGGHKNKGCGHGAHSAAKRHGIVTCEGLGNEVFKRCFGEPLGCQSIIDGAEWDSGSVLVVGLFNVFCMV